MLRFEIWQARLMSSLTANISMPSALDRRSERGFSVIELVVTMTIASILASTAIGQFTEINSVFDRWNARTLLLQDIRYGQAKSVTQGCRGVFTISGGGNTYSFGCDYLNYDTADPIAADTVFINRTFPTSINLSVDDTIIFNPKGQIINSSGALETRTLALTDTGGGETVEFATASIYATGVFVFD